MMHVHCMEYFCTLSILAICFHSPYFLIIHGLPNLQKLTNLLLTLGIKMGDSVGGSHNRSLGSSTTGSGGRGSS